MNANTEINNFTSNQNENQLDSESLLNRILEYYNQIISEQNYEIRYEAIWRLAHFSKKKISKINKF